MNEGDRFQVEAVPLAFPIPGGRWLGGSRDGGIVVVLPSPLEDNPSVSLSADSSLYTREPLILPTFGASSLGPKASHPARCAVHLPPGEGYGERALWLP